MDIPIFNEDGGQVGTFAFDEKKLLGEKVRTKLLHQAIIRYEANLRVGTHKTKSKAERHGSGLKPFKQKHTGRARAGMKRSPLWRGGGNAFPIRQRDYHKDMPARMRREALKSALLSKFIDKEIRVIDAFNYDTPKTKRFTTSLKKLGIDGTTCLVSVRNPASALVRSIRNVDRVRIIPARNLNAYDVLKHKHLIINKDTLENLAEVVKV